MISLRNLSRVFDGRAALSIESLDVAKGETLAILGPSGSGKTTLLRLISGLDHPDSGTIIVDGNVVSSPNRAVPARSRKVGMIFQDLALWPHMTAEQHVVFALSQDGLSRKAIAERAVGNLKAVRLGGLLKRYPAQLSGGEKQRLAIARAVAPNPACLLMDEPFSGLDMILKQEMMNLTLKLKKERGMTIVYVTHSLEEACCLADRILVLNHGEAVWDSPKKEVIGWTYDDFVKVLKGK